MARKESAYGLQNLDYGNGIFQLLLQLSVIQNGYYFFRFRLRIKFASPFDKQSSFCLENQKLLRHVDLRRHLVKLDMNLYAIL